MSATGPASCDACVLGNLNIDLLVDGLQSLPEWGREVIVGGHRRVSSGQAGLLAMGLAALQVDTRLVANVGNDRAGSQILADLAAAGVRVDDVEQSEGATGLSIALVREDGERAFVTDLGCLVDLDEVMVRRHTDALSSPHTVCLVGIFMTPGLNLDVVIALAREARERGQLTVVDTGWDPSGWPPTTVAAMRGLAAHTDMLLINESEAAALSGSAHYEKAAETLHGWGADTVVVKRGGLGAHAHSSTGVCDVDALRVEVCDTVGAGDTFNAGFIAARLSGATLDGAMRLGSAAAGIYCSRLVNRFPSRGEALEASAKLHAFERPNARVLTPTTASPGSTR